MCGFHPRKAMRSLKFFVLSLQMISALVRLFIHSLQTSCAHPLIVTPPPMFATTALPTPFQCFKLCCSVFPDDLGLGGGPPHQCQTANTPLFCTTTTTTTTTTPPPPLDLHTPTTTTTTVTKCCWTALSSSQALCGLNAFLFSFHMTSAWVGLFIVPINTLGNSALTPLLVDSPPKWHNCTAYLSSML